MKSQEVLVIVIKMSRFTIFSTVTEILVRKSVSAFEQLFLINGTDIDTNMRSEYFLLK